MDGNSLKPHKSPLHAHMVEEEMRNVLFGHFQASRWVDRNQVYMVYGMPFLPCLIILSKESRGLIMGTCQPFCYCLQDKTPAVL